MKPSRTLPVFLFGAAAALITPAVFAQAGVASGAGCDSGWSDGTCWVNTITTPPSQTPPVPGQVVGISPFTTVTLDVDAQALQLDVYGTMRQPTHSLTADGVLVGAGSGFVGTYELSGGLLTVGGSNTFGVEITGGNFNQGGGALVSTNAIAIGTLGLFGLTGTYNLSAGDVNAGGLVLGNGVTLTGINGTTPVYGPNKGIFNQSGGAVVLSGPVVLGGPLDPARIAGGVGVLTISDGTFDVSSSVGFGLVVGGTGTGTVTQSGGTVTITSGPTSGGLELGRSAGGSGTYSLSGGELNVNREAVAGPGAYVLVGNAGSGAFTQTGGTVSIEGTLTLGASAGGSGTYDLSGTGTLLEAEHVVIRTGTFTQSAGRVSIDTNSPGPTGGSLSIFVGGAYALSAGPTNDSRLEVEYTEIIQGGVFTQSGGTNKVDGPLSLGNGGQYFLGGAGSQLTVGDDVTVTNASITQTGGSAQVNGGLSLDGVGTGVGSYALGGLGNLAVAAGEVIGDGGLGTFTHTAGTNSLAGGTLTLGRTDTGNGTYSLSGTGILAAGGDVVVGDAGVGRFDQTGGTVNIAGTLTLGATAGSQGKWTLSDGELHVTTGEVVGNAGTGVFIQSGGTHTIAGDLSIAATAGSAGTFTLSDGSLQVAGNERIGLVPGAVPASTNAFIQSGGTNQVSGTLIVGAGGGGLYTLSGGTIQATNETIGALGTGTGVFNQSGGVNSVSGTLTIGGGTGTSGTYNLSGGIINAGTPRTEGLVNNGALNVTGTSFISANVLNSATGIITVTGAALRVNGVITNLGTITLDPSTVTVQGLTVGASGVLIAGAGDVVSVLGDFMNDSVQNTLWNTDAAELDFTGGVTHLFALAGRDSAGFANNFSWGTLSLGTGNMLDLAFGSGDALYVDVLEGLAISGNVITNITGASGLFLYYNAADNPLLDGNYFLEGGGELVALGSGGGSGGGGATVAEPSTLGLLLAALSAAAAFGRLRHRRREAV
jgi:fibronectin-binding autotransporter adhesin